jgi:hypothetical protein
MRSIARLSVILFSLLIVSPVTHAEVKPDPSKQAKPAVKAKTDTTPTKSMPETPTAVKASVPDTVRYGFLTVTRPQGGGYFVQGSDLMIEWSKEGYIPSSCYRIGLIKDGKEIRQITPSVCVNGYTWKIPTDLWGSGFKVRVETVDKKVAAESKAFPIINAKADLTLSQLTVTPQALDQGQDAVIRVRIDNGGYAKSEPMKAFIIMGFWDTILANAKKVEYAVPALNFGDHIYLTHTEKFPAGDLFVVARVGKFWTPGSGDKMLPDDKYVRVSVRGGKMPDLVACIYHPSKAPVGSPFHISAIVQNVGEDKAAYSKMNIWVEGQGSISVNVPPLDKGEFYRFGRSVTFQNEGETSFRVEVDGNNEVTETNETNNRITGKIIHRSTQDPTVQTEEVCSDGRRKPL